MSKSDYRIRSKKKPHKEALNKPSKPCNYKGTDYGFPASLTGSNVRVALIDTGNPSHSDINSVVNSVDMLYTSDGVVDTHGHATMVAGVLAANNPKTVCGISPNVKLFCPKVVNGSGECSYDAIVSGILWSIVQDVHVILISLGSKHDFNLLHDAITKAYDNNICVFAAAGNNSDSNDYPADYPEVLSVGRRVGKAKSKPFGAYQNSEIQVVVPDDEVYTTFLNDMYIKASGSSLTAAMIAGLASLLIERYISNGEVLSPNSIYSELANISYKPIK